MNIIFAISLFLQPLQYLGTKITDDLEFLGRCQIVVGSLFSLSDKDLKALTASAPINRCLPVVKPLQSFSTMTRAALIYDICVKIVYTDIFIKLNLKKYYT